MPDNCGKEHTYIVITQDPATGSRYKTQTRAYSKQEAGDHVLATASKYGDKRELVEVRFLWF